MKQKTSKSISKRVKVSGASGSKKKLTRRATGQNHYNSRATGNANRSKKLDETFFKTDEKNIFQHALPYA